MMIKVLVYNVYLDKELARRYIMIKVLLDNVYLNKELVRRYIMIKVLLDNVYLDKGNDKNFQSVVCHLFALKIPEILRINH